MTQIIFYLMGVLLLFNGGFILLSSIVSLIFNDGVTTEIFSAGVTVLIFGLILIFSTKNHEKQIQRREGYLIVTFGWLLMIFSGMLPYLFSGTISEFSYAFFETTSGYTATGSTILKDVESLPKSIIFWRSTTHWIGGMGIIVLTIAILPLLGVGGMQLFSAEAPGPNSDKLHPRITDTAKRLWYIYVGFTLTETLLLNFAGMSFFDAINNSMSTIATGGFSTHNDSIGFFKNSNIEIVASLFIILGSIPFISYLKFSQGNKKVFFQDVQIKGLIYLLAFSITIMFLYLLFINYESSLFEKIRISSFNVISILSGTGYVTDDFGLWGKFSLIFFLLLMFIGGCAGSTACGIKIFRLQMLLIFLKNQVKKLIYPNSVIITKYNNHKISDDFIRSVIIFIFSFLFIFLIIAMLLSISGLDFVTSISGAASSISNVGPGLGEIIGPDGNYKSLPDLSKWILATGMLLGRLELFAVLVLFFPSFWRN